MKPKPQRGTHPAERFVAPSAIPHGSALAKLIGRPAVELLAESLAAVDPRFDEERFTRNALRGLGKLKLMERAAHVAAALAEELPPDFDDAAPLLLASFGPELSATEGNGLAPFFYLPHSQFIGRYGVGHFDAGMAACYALTKRFTAEFCVRPFLVEHQVRVLKQLRKWTTDPNPHVRRLVSEGTRPRLPWGIRLKAFQTDPRPTLALLERLKNDPAPYVQRSVANHLGDLLKDNPDAAFAVCERWLREARTRKLPPAQLRARLWILRHAVRLPAKKGDPRALKLRQAAK